MHLQDQIPPAPPVCACGHVCRPGGFGFGATSERKCSAAPAKRAHPRCLTGSPSQGGAFYITGAAGSVTFNNVIITANTASGYAYGTDLIAQH